MTRRASARACFVLLIGWGLAQEGCLFFCGKSKVTFQNRCASHLVHDFFVDDVKVGSAAWDKDFGYDLAAGTYVIAQDHQLAALPPAPPMSTTQCADSRAIVPRCSEVQHQCTL